MDLLVSRSRVHNCQIRCDSPRLDADPSSQTASVPAGILGGVR
jgi:hypothetical protein